MRLISLPPLRLSNWILVASLSMTICTFADSPDEDSVDTIVVTSEYLHADKVNALKTPTPVIDVPQSLSIVTEDQISKQAFTSIGDIINYIPGVNTSQGEGHRDAVVFRGVRSTADFFVDGARDDVQYYRPLYNLEQVEILRGPNALLFGRGGTGGILNRVTKKGIIGKNFSKFKTSANIFREFDFQVDSNIVTGESSAFRLNALYENLENHRDSYDGDRFGINPVAKFKLAEATTLDLSYEYANHQRFIDRGIPTGSDGKPVAEFKKIVFGDPQLNTTELEAHLFRASLQHEFSETLKANFAVFNGDYDKLYQNFYASSYDQKGSPNLVKMDGYLDTTQRQNLIVSGNLIRELYTGSTGHTIIVGMEYIDTTSDQDRYNAWWDRTSDDNEYFEIRRPLGLVNGIGVNASGATTTNNFSIDLNDDTKVGVEVLSAYFQDQISISDKLDIILGARFDSFEINVFNVPINDRRDRKDEEISPRFGMVFKPRENLSLYASHSESFLPRSGEQFANINGSKNRLDPNTFTNSEVGIKWNFNDKINLTAAIFEIEQSSPQVADGDPSTLDVIDTEISGFEAQIQSQVANNWFMSAGYGYLEGEQVDRSGPNGKTPRELPENKFSLWNNYRLTNKFSVALGLIFQDESFINNGNTATLPSYTRFDFAAYYSLSETIQVQLNIENLTDELYFPNAHSTHQVTVGAPLTARLSFSARFN